MIVKKYTAETETGAVLLAKEELGSDAVVLNVKNMKQRGFARLFKKDFVEITAALEESKYSSANKSRKTDIKENKPVLHENKIDIKVDDSNENAQSQELIGRKLDGINTLLKKQIENDVLNENESGTTKESAKSGENVNFKSLRLIYNKLLENEVDEKYANNIINDIENSLKKETTLDSMLASVYQKLILKLGEPEPITVSNKRKVVFFMGPTGVGKTTTIAKLASNFKLTNNKSIAIITADTYRISAVEQLNTYASILDVPIEVIYENSEIIPKINQLSDREVIFFDTAGRSHKNEEQRNDIIEMIRTIENSELNVDIEIYLVLSVTTKYRDLISIADAYKEIQNIKLLFTKLDETSSLGNVLNLKCYTDAPISYITSGQNVPDDIETIDVQKLAKKLLGG